MMIGPVWCSHTKLLELWHRFYEVQLQAHLGLVAHVRGGCCGHEIPELVSWGMGVMFLQTCVLLRCYYVYIQISLKAVLLFGNLLPTVPISFLSISCMRSTGLAKITVVCH